MDRRATRSSRSGGRPRRQSPARKANNPSPPARRPSPSRRVSPGRKASPIRRQKTPPPRRTSRPRSTVLGQNAASAAVSLNKDAKETKPSSKNINSNLPLTATTNTSTRAPNQTTLTSSTHSSYSSYTQKTVEIRSSTGRDGSRGSLKDISKLSELIRSSVERALGGKEKGNSFEKSRTHTPTTNTEADSRDSRSRSISTYGKNTENGEEEESEDDDDDIEGEHFKSLNASPPSIGSRKIEAPTEFGGFWGVLVLMSFAPPILYYLQWTCRKSGCSFRLVNLVSLIDFTYLSERVFQKEAISAYLLYSSGMILLSSLLFGKRVRLAFVDQRNSNYEYKFNALTLAILITIGFFVAECCGYAVADFILSHYLRFCVYGLISAFATALFSYWRSEIMINQKQFAREPLNIYGKTDNPVIDFAQGRQINPKLFGFIDHKQALYRLSLITTLLFAEIFLYKKIEFPPLVNNNATLTYANYWDAAVYFLTNIGFSGSSVLPSIMLLIYTMDAIIFEHHLASSFELQGEGFGFLLLLRYAISPYILSSVSKYFLEHRIPIVCKFSVYVPLLLLIIGLTLKRLSSAIKYKYRIDPIHSHFHGKETIHTFQGRRILLDGFWGRLRQPNYAGDILALIALILPLAIRFAYPPALSIASLIVLLLHRAVRVNARNLARYHSSWVCYCAKVPYYVLPKVY